MSLLSLLLLGVFAAASTTRCMACSPTWFVGGLSILLPHGIVPAQNHVHDTYEPAWAIGREGISWLRTCIHMDAERSSFIGTHAAAVLLLVSYQQVGSMQSNSAVLVMCTHDIWGCTFGIVLLLSGLCC